MRAHTTAWKGAGTTGMMRNLMMAKTTDRITTMIRNSINHERSIHFS
jgi:hypothetical protein